MGNAMINSIPHLKILVVLVQYDSSVLGSGNNAMNKWTKISALVEPTAMGDGVSCGKNMHLKAQIFILTPVPLMLDTWLGKLS